MTGVVSVFSRSLKNFGNKTKNNLPDKIPPEVNGENMFFCNLGEITL